MLTVSELIEILKRFPPDRRVVVDGYESGYDDIDRVYIRSVFILDHSKDTSVLGKYDRCSELMRELYPDSVPFDAVVIPR